MDVKSTRIIVDQAFSVPKCVRLARLSEKSYELLTWMFAANPGRTKDELEPILGRKPILVETSVILRDTSREDQQRTITIQ